MPSFSMSQSLHASRYVSTTIFNKYALRSPLVLLPYLMSNTYDSRPVGDRNTPKRSADLPADLSTIGPLPAYPNLKRILRSWTATLILTYVETHHPPTRDAAGRFTDPPIRISLDELSQAIQTGRRTLFTALCVLCSRFKTEEDRVRAARAAREFFNTAHTTNGTIKHYSMVGPSSHRPGTVVRLRRNHRLIAQTLQMARLDAITTLSPAVTLNTTFSTSSAYYTHAEADRSIGQLPENHDGPASIPSLPKESQNSRLIEALLSRSVLSGDRRSVRYPRLRKAVEGGLEGEEVLKVVFNPRSAAKRGNIYGAKRKAE